MGSIARLLRIPANASKYAVLGGMTSIVAATMWITYERFVNRNPMRLRRDAEGGWHWVTYAEFLDGKLAESEEKLRGAPDSRTYQYMVKGYRRALDKERSDRAAERAAAGITEEEAKRACDLRDEDLRV